MIDAFILSELSAERKEATDTLMTEDFETGTSTNRLNVLQDKDPRRLHDMESYAATGLLI